MMTTNDTEPVLSYIIIQQGRHMVSTQVFVCLFVCCFKESGKYNMCDWRECFTNLGGEIQLILCSLNTYSVSNTVPAAVDAKINKT